MNQVEQSTKTYCQDVSALTLDIDAFEATLMKADEVFLTLDLVLEFTNLVITNYHDTQRLRQTA